MSSPETLVLKFGGSSVGSPERIHRVAKIVASHRAACSRVVVVVSAMGDTTDELIELAKKVSPQAETLAHRREMDMLLSTGERISMALLSMALSDIGVDAISLTGSQSGIITTQSFGEACIQEIKPIRIRASLDEGKVVIVAGFQGVSATHKEITTLGRGGSDTSAVALAINLQAKECLIYTDVDGYYSADPRKVRGARKIEVLPWQLAIEGASRGAQVLHPRCVELAWKYGLPLRVCNSFIDNPEFARANISGTRVEGMIPQNLESAKIYSVALQKQLSLVELSPYTDVVEAGHYIEKLCTKGFRSLAWAFESPKLKVLVEAGQRAFLDEKVIGEQKELYRLSVIGSGLSHSPGVLRELSSLAAKHGVETVEFRLQATSAELVFRAPKPEAADALLSDSHAHYCT